ncbi:hypothetical protein QQG91_13810 [Marivivens sp. LCG002]|uniref:hypothetical protein n=1 Tax=Marivivens sp. LCG002 TaxID=3051171 RepID=UPI002555A333|nr:hypothetical protein [Marivivens sp. LCG002]WIV50720.1 hypothetical protein QQG91_13810 [Marivivens sp. LCG002]
MNSESIQTDNAVLILLKPIYEPFNPEAEQLTSLLLKRLQLPCSGPKFQSYNCIMASFIHAALRAIRWKDFEASKPRSQQKHIFVGMLLGHDHWTQFPAVGAKIGKRTLEALETGGLIKRDPSSGKREFHTTEAGKAAYEGVMTRWKVTQKLTRLLPKDGVTFIETGRPLVQINQVETRSQKEKRKRHSDTKRKLTHSEATMLFGGCLLQGHEARIQALNEYWRKHPLVSPNGNAAACVTRVFSDSRLDVGGRLYGSWTNSKSDHRLDCTIDGEPMLQLDISASQPTLLSILLNVEMQNLSPQKSWYDPYTELTGLIGHAMHGGLTDYERGEAVKRVRTISKRIVMELIGTGNPNKAVPSEDLLKDTNISQDEWNDYKQELKAAIPALNKLEPRYDSCGNPTGYINGPAFLAFHESEMMLQTLEKLSFEYDIPAFPVHDCLLVKVSDWETAYTVFVQTISSYVKEMTGRQVVVPISREGGGLPYRKFRGVYDTSIPQHLLR